MSLMIVGRVDGDLKALLNAPLDEVADAARLAVRTAAEALQAELRAQVAAAGLGVGLEKAWRMDVYPRSRRTFRPAALVYSKATRLHAAFDAGETITAKGGKWLCVPLPAAIAAGVARSAGRGDADRGGRFRATDAKWSNVAAAEERFGPLRFVPIGNGARAFLVADGKVRGDRVGAYQKGRAASLPLFLLVPQVRGRKLLDIDGAASRAQARLSATLSNILPR